MTYLDTRYLAEELDELEARRDDEDQTDPLDKDDTARLAALEELRDKVGDEWRYGETMIPEDEFEDYAEQYADDLGITNSDTSWPLNHIDWKAAAEALSVDYTSVTFDGIDYYVRT